MSFLFLSTLVVVLAGIHANSEPIVTFDYVEVESFGIGQSTLLLVMEGRLFNS